MQHARGQDEAQLSRELARALSQVFRRSYGRGPERIRTYVHGDYVLFLLHDSLLTAERTLVRAGRHELVEETRAALQDAVRQDFIDVVEELTGRRVESFLSANDVKTGLSSELFTFAPAGA
jgi:uncharacterized protein YbcI